MKRLAWLLLLLFMVPAVQSAVKTETVDYKHGKTKLQGFLAYDDSSSAKKPGILIVHAWNGHGDYVQMRAKQLAELGYVAFALDMYGKGVYAKTNEKAAKLSKIYKDDRELMRARAQAGLDQLTKQKFVDSNNIVAIGYCFGGTVVLELARSGADINGIVSFHGGLSTPHPDLAKNIKAKVLVLHGADDPYAPMTEVQALMDEMKAGGVDYQVVLYGGAVHSFTKKAAGDDPSKGAAYNADADRRSWQAMLNFFDEVLK